MKIIFTISVLYLLPAALSPYAMALPQSIPHGNTLRTLQVLERAPAECSRDLDTEISNVQNAAVSGQAVAIYAVGSGYAALSACRLLAPGGNVGQGTCADVAGLVAAGTAVIYTAVQNHGTGTNPTRRDDSSLATILAEQFQADGTQYEGISAMAVSKRDVYYGNETDSSSRSMQDRLSIKGVQYADGMMDAILTTFSDNTGHIFVNPTPSNATALTKRHDGAGFKINYRRIKYASNILGTPDLKGLNNDLGNGIASNWAVRADNDGINEFILTTGITNPKLETIGVRIIGETAGYGDEYESVDICGTLGSSHDELKV